MSIYLQVESTLDNWTDTRNYETNQVIQFNQIRQQSEATLRFDTGTGVMTFLVPGVYKIDWSVNIQAVSIVSIPIIIALVSSQGDTVIGDSIQRQGTVSGSAILTVNTPGTTVSLVNQSVRITLSGVPVIANLTVCAVGDSNLGYEMGLTNSPGYQCPYGEAIRFNQTIQADNPTISYDQNTGAFTLSQAGIYLVNWWIGPYSYHIAADDADFAELLVAVMVNGEPHTITPFYRGATSLITPSGTTYVRINETPAVLSLANATEDAIITLSQYIRQGRILIVQLS